MEAKSPHCIGSCMASEPGNGKLPVPSSVLEAVVNTGAPQLIRSRAAQIAFGWLDQIVFLGQVVIKGLGLQTLTRATPPEAVSPSGDRLAVLPGAVGHWPRTEIPLPPGSVFHVAAESMLQRAALWFAMGTLDDVVAFLRDALRNYAVEVRDVRSGSVHVFYIAPSVPTEPLNVLTSVNLNLNDQGVVMFSVRQERSPSRRTRRMVRRATPWALRAGSGGQRELHSDGWDKHVIPNPSE